MVSHSLLTGCRTLGDAVLILIVMDNGLSQLVGRHFTNTPIVLILIVMDNGLSHWGMCDGTASDELS